MPESRIFRFISSGPSTACENMGTDRALIDSVSGKNSVPVLRFYEWTHPSITIGYFQKRDETVNSEYCRSGNIPVIRRVTGGGAVLHNMELTYSITVPLDRGYVPSEIDSSFRYIIEPLIRTLNELGIPAVFKPVNDILADGRKISGSAQTRKQGVLQQHGTLLLDLDRELFMNALKFDMDKLKLRGFSDPFDGMTTVRECLENNGKPEISKSGLADRLKKSFSLSMDAVLQDSSLSREEQELAKDYARTMFSSDQWNLRR